MNTSSCGKTDIYWAVADAMNFIEFKILLPMYATIGIIGGLILLFSFRKQTANEKAYMYQIFLTAIDMFEVLSFTTFKTVVTLTGGNGYEWLQRIYPVIFYRAHIGRLLTLGCTNIALLMSCCMSADRVFAMLKPLVYKNLKHRRIQVSALIFSVSLGLAMSLNTVFEFDVIQSLTASGLLVYKAGGGEAWLSSLPGYILDIMSNAARVVGLLTLISLNVSVIRLYRRRLNKVAKMTNQTNQTSGESAIAARKKASERSLFLLTILQSFFMSIRMIDYTILFSAKYASSSPAYWLLCVTPLSAPLSDNAQLLAGITDTICVLAFNKKSRRMLQNAFYFISCRESVVST